VSERALPQPASRIEVAVEEMPQLVGSRDCYLRTIEERLDVRLRPADGAILVYGSADSARQATEALKAMLRQIRRGNPSNADDLAAIIEAVLQDTDSSITETLGNTIVLTHRNQPLKPKTVGQARYVEAVGRHDLVFCIGPAGTGKTFLAMALAVSALRSGQVSRLVLTRPIVEAGEQLGFLPGDMLEKVQPYLRPLHDALSDIIGFERLQRLRGRGIIEVMPLAYMRGRTINDAFIVLDEAQNTTPGQMRMFLTRMGFGSKMIVTGDITQTDLPAHVSCGLVDAIGVLDGVAGIDTCELGRDDIVRHPLVQRVVDAYEISDRAQRDGAQERPASGDHQASVLNESK
jgi:phosphate starvation-inducible PhoH-like protein